MSRNRVARPTSAVALGLAPLLVLASINVGLGLSPLGLLDALARGAPLDYSRGPADGFAPLRAPFVEGVLGALVAEPETPASGTGRRSTRPIPPPDELPIIEVPHSPTNNDFGSAYAVPSVPFTARTHTGEATSQPGEPAPCTPVNQGGTLWYRYRPASNLGLVANTFGTSHPVALAVFTGSDLSALTQVGCSSDARGNALVAFSPVSGQNYYFQVRAAVTRGDLIFSLLLQGITTRASVSSSGRQGDRYTGIPVVSADGRFVAFNSVAGTFTPRSVPRLHPDHSCAPTIVFDPQGGTGAICILHVYFRDRAAHTTSLVSVSSQGTPGDGSSIVSGMSADARYVVFTSNARNLVPGDTNACAGLPLPGQCPDVFVHDRRTHVTSRVSVGSSGEQGNGLSHGGWISRDGRYVAFTSAATNLVPGDDNGAPDAFVHDRVAARTTRISVSSAGAQANAAASARHPLDKGSTLLGMSRNGRYILFRSAASNLVPNDTNQAFDVFVRDRVAGTTIRVSVAGDGTQANGDTRHPMLSQQSISDDGRYALFGSDATNLVPRDANGAEDLFMRDVVAGTTELITVSSTGEQADGFERVEQDGHSYLATIHAASWGIFAATEMLYSMTPNGRFVVFASGSKNLVPGDGNELKDIFLRDRATRTTTRVSVTSSGQAPDNSSNHPTISEDGRHVLFHSLATNLVGGDANNQLDVFGHEIVGHRRTTGWF
ncbi:MAG: hypothetical protein ACRDJM_09200 [Actinomycetota bacterium]